MTFDISKAVCVQVSCLCCAGKTTLLRDVTCQLADKYKKLVMVVDTSQEIAGCSHAPHACIGSARRLLSGRQKSKCAILAGRQAA